MLKFLRKYNKWILVFGGSLLMIAFLVPQGIQQMGSHKRGQTVARLGERKVRQLDFQQASGELQMIERLLQQPNPMGVDARQSAAHWILLTHAAEKAGLYAGEAEGRDVFDQIAESVAARTGERLTVEGVAANSRFQPSEVYDALAKAAAVFRLRSAHTFAAVLSDRKAAAAAKSLADQTRIDLVLVTGGLADRDNPPPEEAALQEQFSTYRGVKKGEGEYGFGYLLPARLKLEWMRLDRTAIEAAVVIDPVDANKRWRTNRTTYVGEFEAEKAAVEGEIRAEVVDHALRAAHDAVKAEVYNATKSLQTDGRYRRIPSEWPRLRWEQIAQAVVARVNEGQNTDSSHVVMPLPQVVVREAEWSTAEELYRDPDLSGATVRFGQQQAPLAAVLMQTKEINTQPQLVLQAGIPPVDLFATQGEDRIYFTVTDARPESPPDTLDEVRDEVTTDVRAMRGLMVLTADADIYRDMAAEGGLTAIVNYFSIAPVSPQTPELAAAAVPPEIKEGVAITPEWGGGALPVEDEEFRKAVLNRSALLDPLDRVEDVAAAYRTHAVVSKKNVGLVLFVVRNLEPLTIEQFRVSGWRLQQVMQKEVQDAGEEKDPFAYESLVERYHWTPLGGEEEPGDEEGANGGSGTAGR